MKVSLSPDTQGLEQNTSYPPQIWNGLAQVSQEPLIVIIVVIWILRHLFTSSGLAKISAIFLVYSSLHCFITAKLPVTIWMQRRHHSTICFGFHEAPSPLSGMFRSVTAFLVQPHRRANDMPLGTLSRLSETKFKTISSSAVRLKTFISNHCTAKSVCLAWYRFCNYK